METIKTAFIIALASVISGGAYFLGWFVLGLGVIIVILSFSYIYVSKYIIKDNKYLLLKKIGVFLGVFVFYIVLIYGYIIYGIKSLPTHKTFIESFRMVRLSNFLGFEYYQGMTNYEYVKLRQKFRKDLSYYKKDANLEVIWQNMIKDANMIKKVSDLFYKMTPIKKFKIHNIKYSIYYEVYYSDAPFLCSDVKFKLLVDDRTKKEYNVDLVDKSKRKFKIISKENTLYAFMPYINMEIWVDKNDTDRFQKIAHYLDEIHKNLEENKKYLKNLNMI